MAGCGGRVVQPAQGDEARQEFGVEHLLGGDLAVVRGQRSRRRRHCRRAAAGGPAGCARSRTRQARPSARRAVLAPRRAATAPGHPRCGRHGAASGRGRAPSPGSSRAAAGRAASSASALDASRCRARRASAAHGAPHRGAGSAEPPLSCRARRGAGTAPTDLPAERRRTSGAGRQSRRPRRRCRRARRCGPLLPPVHCPRHSPGLGAAQHRLRQGQAVAVALRQNRRLVRFGGDRLLPSTLQQRLAGPVRILRHEVGDLVSRRGARRQQPEVGDELGRDRIGVGCGGELGIRPPVGRIAAAGSPDCARAGVAANRATRA